MKIFQPFYPLTCRGFESRLRQKKYSHFYFPGLVFSDDFNIEIRTNLLNDHASKYVFIRA